MLETVGTPVFLDAWNGDKQDRVQDSATMFLILGVVGVIVFFLIGPLKRVCSDKTLLTFGFVITGVGSFLLINSDDSLPRFLIGACFIWSFGSPISQTIILSAFSSILGSNQGFDLHFILNSQY